MSRGPAEGGGGGVANGATAQVGRLQGAARGTFLTEKNIFCSETISNYWAQGGKVSNCNFL
jgi:hypothetical protein